MAKILRTRFFPSATKIKDPSTKTWAKGITFFLDDIFRKVSNIPFNQSEYLTVADTGNADTEFSITHHLGRAPTGYILTKSDKACAIYDSGTTWTSTLVYLKCDTANVALEVYVF